MFDESSFSSAKEDETTVWLDSFSHLSLSDRGKLVGLENAKKDEEILKQERLQDYQKSNNDAERRAKAFFTGNATIFKNQNGSMYAVIYTEWLDPNNELEGTVRSTSRRIDITEEKLHELRKQRDEKK